MARTIAFTTGDGITTPFITGAATLPDSGQVVNIEGSVIPLGGGEVALIGTSVTVPAPPGSGFIYWIIQSDASGNMTIKQSTTGFPAPDAGNVVIFQDQMGPADVLSGDMAAVPF